MARTREEIKKKAQDLFDDFGGPMEVGLRHFTEYVEIVLDFIEEKLGNPDQSKSA